ncbi:aprataxin and PNK-like factor, partial [Manduca sexta]|uniref:aprataxin and PNK-like factor n=1 Tax=Manduca sexta TaxID=7130 RepID=UPI00188F52BD
ENEYDNKVSRNHAELLVTDDEVTLTAYVHPLIFYAADPEKDAESAKDNKKEGESVEKEADNEDLSKEVNFEPNETAQEGGQSSPSTLGKSQDQDEKAQSPLKRPISPNNGDGEEIKKVKTDDDNADEAGPSNGASTSDDKNDNGPVRERCMYGASCYRKNLQHRAQYSHPADADWPAAERRACAFGAACRRRDPRHRALPAPAPPRDAAAARRTRSGEKKKKKVDDSSSLIVTTKRQRKTVKMDAWSDDSEVEQDPYATDESDEWQPSSDFTDTQAYTSD